METEAFSWLRGIRLPRPSRTLPLRSQSVALTFTAGRSKHYRSPWKDKALLPKVAFTKERGHPLNMMRKAAGIRLSGISPGRLTRQSMTTPTKTIMKTTCPRSPLVGVYRPRMLIGQET